MTKNQEPLIINGWENGIGESPLKGFGLIRCADIGFAPGSVRVGKKPTSMFLAGNSRTFTAVAATNVCTASDVIETGLLDYTGMAVKFSTTGTLPAGLSINTVYFLIKVTDTTFKVAASYKNSAGSTPGTEIDITDTGTGVHTMTPVPIGTINWIVRNGASGTHFMLDSNGRVWFAPTGTRCYLLLNSALDNGATALANASGNGLALLTNSGTGANEETFLIVFRNALIDLLDVENVETLGWTNGWQTMNTAAGISNTHHAILAQDNIVYYCDGRYIGSIREKPGQIFDPATAATYTFNSQALDLPKKEIAQCLEELGVNLLIGGNFTNKIYPWDRISDSFSLPIAVPEYSIKKMKNIGGVVYILPGTWGNIYKTQGTYISTDIYKIPQNLINSGHDIITNPITWGDAANGNGDLLFGLNGNTSGTDGIYRLSTSGVLTHENIPSTGSKIVTAIYATSDFYIIGYAGGADAFAGLLYSNYETVIQTALYSVGNKNSKALYSEMEVQLLYQRQSGNIRIKYRTSLGDSFADFPGGAVLIDSGSGSSFNFDIGLIDIENIQLQIEMDKGAGTGVGEDLFEIRLYP